MFYKVKYDTLGLNDNKNRVILLWAHEKRETPHCKKPQYISEICVFCINLQQLNCKTRNFEKEKSFVYVTVFKM